MCGSVYECCELLLLSLSLLINYHVIMFNVNYLWGGV